MFKKILFATTASERCNHAARVAFEIAGRYGSEMEVFHVVGEPTRGFSPYVRDSRTGEDELLNDDYLEWVQDELKNTYDRQLTQSQGKVSLKAVAGVTHTEILREARKFDADLIVMGANTTCEREETSRRSVVAGATLQAVAKSARCPVLVVSRPAGSFWGGFSNIVFGTDFSKASDAAFTFAAKVSKDLGCTLHVFHALDIAAMGAGAFMEQDEIEDKLIGIRQKMQKQYGVGLKGLDEYELEVWEGTPYVEIVKFAREKHADLIVMAHHSTKRDEDKQRLGSTMEQVVLRATCPVASVNRADKLQ